MKVLVIPEDERADRYIVGPIITAMLASTGIPSARVQVCQDPVLGGVGEALKWSVIEEILGQYRAMVDLFVLIVDRDGEEGRKQQLNRLETLASDDGHSTLLCENAWEEVETWLLAGHEEAPKVLGRRWRDIRAAVQCKERCFVPYAEHRGVCDGPGGGRKVLGREAASSYPRIVQLCPEDVGHLEARIGQSRT
ncbi:MAG: hypothetical protein GF320_21275 [Armatimonadia bacterium]|nr:hypothetical protein [Armatimonadia bacterium]